MTDRNEIAADELERITPLYEADREPLERIARLLREPNLDTVILMRTRTHLKDALHIKAGIDGPTWRDHITDALTALDAARSDDEG